MVEMVWVITVREESRGQFELAFGPGGAWGRLFGRCAGFRGTTLLRDTLHAQRYLVIDIWDTAAQREQALAEYQDEVAALEATFAAWVEERVDLGTFSILAEATVRPHGKAGPARRGGRRPPR